MFQLPQWDSVGELLRSHDHLTLYSAVLNDGAAPPLSLACDPKLHGL